MISQYLDSLFGSYIGVTGAGLLIFLALLALLLYFVFKRG